MSTRIKRLAAMPAVFAVGVSAMLAGCDQTDPYKREGMWQPVGANAINIAAMVERPADLIRGHGAQGFPVIEAVPPVLNLWAGKPAALPGATSTGGAPGPSAPPTAPSPGAGGS
jgi:type IV pilus biogenesis protein CpaD/CtpE